MDDEHFMIKVEEDDEIIIEESEVKPIVLEPKPKPVLKPFVTCTLCRKLTTDLDRHNRNCHVTCNVCAVVCKDSQSHKQHKKCHEKLLHNIVINCDSSSDSEGELAVTVTTNCDVKVYSRRESKPEVVSPATPCPAISHKEAEKESRKTPDIFYVNCQLPWTDIESDTEEPMKDLDDFPQSPLDYAEETLDDSLKLHPHTCNICLEPIKMNSTTKHKAEFHPTIMCDVCGASIEFNRFSYHQGIHSEKYKCNICSKVLSKQSSMDVHIRMEHTGQTNRICEICGKEFFTEKHLNMHVARHNKILNYTCNQCHKKFFNSFALKSHMRQHTDERPYQCECGEAFKHNVSLKAHKKSKHGIVEERKVQCKFCVKKFASDGARLTHMRKHH